MIARKRRAGYFEAMEENQGTGTGKFRMRVGRTRALFLVAVLLTGPDGAWGEETLLRERRASATAPVFDCIPATELALGGVRLFTSVEKLTAAMTPHVPSNKPINDEGYYILGYAGLHAYIADGIIVRLKSNTAKLAMPSGIRQGMSWDDVIGILGREPSDGSPGDNSFLLFACTLPKRPSWVIDVYGSIWFDGHARVSLIEIVAVGGED